jgi:hypothetical protein
MFQQYDHIVEDVIMGCPAVPKEECIKHHDWVCTQLCFNMCKEVGMEKGKWYKHIPEPFATS